MRRLGNGRRIRDSQQFEKDAVHLHKRICGAPRMARDRRQCEAETPICLARRVEVADGEDEVIDVPWSHGSAASVAASAALAYFNAENVVGVSIILLILATI
jgi:hypothetical protein